IVRRPFQRKSGQVDPGVPLDEQSEVRLQLLDLRRRRNRCRSSVETSRQVIAKLPRRHGEMYIKPREKSTRWCVSMSGAALQGGIACRFGKPGHVRGKDGDRGGGHPGTSQSVSERVGTHVPEPLNNFSRKSRNAVEWKVLRDPTTFVFTRSRDFALLTTEVAGEFD